MSSEMMHPDEWLAAAKAVDVGRKEKVRHLCGDASLVVYNNVDSWSAWCWRCHTRGWVPKETPNMAERLARKAQQERIDRELSYRVSAPQPREHDIGAWTPAARVWLYKAGLTPQRIRHLGAYFHKATGRVVLPVKDSNGADVFWQARNPEYPSGGPKYISASIPRERIHCSFYVSTRDTGGDGADAICLTEDILSAYKVGTCEAGVEGYAVCGTSLGQHTIARLITAGKPVLLWLDPDEAGETARQTITKQLVLVGIAVAAIRTAKDPKRYSFGEISDVLRGRLRLLRDELSQPTGA